MLFNYTSTGDPLLPLTKMFLSLQWVMCIRRICNFEWWKFTQGRFAVELCSYLFLSSVCSEKNRWLTTQCFDQYALIVFRKLCMSETKMCSLLLNGFISVERGGLLIELRSIVYEQQMQLRRPTDKGIALIKNPLKFCRH